MISFFHVDSLLALAWHLHDLPIYIVTISDHLSSVSILFFSWDGSWMMSVERVFALVTRSYYLKLIFLSVLWNLPIVLFHVWWCLALCHNIPGISRNVVFTNQLLYVKALFCFIRYLIYSLMSDAFEEH